MAKLVYWALVSEDDPARTARYSTRKMAKHAYSLDDPYATSPPVRVEVQLGGGVFDAYNKGVDAVLNESIALGDYVETPAGARWQRAYNKRWGY
tara:strand:- start:3589 stop:3870 length:282 start_codon:yes stop_codon:yes gene_type:complete